MSTELYDVLAGLSMAEGRAALRARGYSGTDSDVLFYRQRGKCFYCGCQMTKRLRLRGEPTNPKSLTVDHILTRRMGGRMGPKVGACFGCNSRRGDMPAHDFLLVVATEAGIVR